MTHDEAYRLYRDAVRVVVEDTLNGEPILPIPTFSEFLAENGYEIENPPEPDEFDSSKSEDIRAINYRLSIDFDSSKSEDIRAINYRLSIK